MMTEKAKKNLGERKADNNERLHSEGLLKGKPFSPRRLEASIEALKDIYGHKGYKDAKVSYKIAGMSEKNAIEVQFVIDEGQRFFVDKIEIKSHYPYGSIARELELSPGDTIDTEAAKRAIEALLSTGLFSGVDIYYEETDRPDRLRLVVKTVDQPRDNPIPEKLVEKAENGDVKSQCWLGHCYVFGIGTKVDKKKAFFWYTKAAEQGDDCAKRSLAQIERFPTNPQQNP